PVFGSARRGTGGESIARPSWCAPSMDRARQRTWYASPAGKCCAPIVIRRLSMGSSIGDRLSSVGFTRMNDGGGVGGKVKRVLGIIAALVIALVLLLTTVTYVNPGYVGIVIHRAGGG